MRRLVFCAASVWLASSCFFRRTPVEHTRVFRDTWQPVGLELEPPPRVTALAIEVTNGVDIASLQSAGAVVVGFHTKGNRLGLRAGSTGGTHFVPMESSTSDRTVCTAFGKTAVCSSGRKTRWDRIAVIRVDPSAWRKLPAHLIPTENSVVNPALPRRVGCRTRWEGTVQCGQDWTVR